jgi:hypothetical protein
MKQRHSREQVRTAKAAAADRFRDDDAVTSVGIGMTEDRSDYAVTITVSSAQALPRMPLKIGSVPVRVAVVGKAARL